MSSLKRTLVTIGTVIITVVVVVSGLVVWLPKGDELAASIHGVLFLRILAAIAVTVALLVVIFLIKDTIMLYLRRTAVLRTSETGQITIEKSALVSVVCKSLETIPDMALQSVDVEVVLRRGTAVIDGTVVAAPVATDSLMRLAAIIQERVKTTLEAFTELEVRYVAVNFVELKRRGSSMMAEGDEAEAPAPAPAKKASSSKAAPAPASTPEAKPTKKRQNRKAQAQPDPEVDAGPEAEAEAALDPVVQAGEDQTASEWPAWKATGEEPAAETSASADAPAKKPSLWDRAKRLIVGGNTESEVEAPIIDTPAQEAECEELQPQPEAVAQEEPEPAEVADGQAQEGLEPADSVCEGSQATPAQEAANQPEQTPNPAAADETEPDAPADEGKR